MKRWFITVNGEILEDTFSSYEEAKEKMLTYTRQMEEPLEWASVISYESSLDKETPQGILRGKK